MSDGQLRVGGERYWKNRAGAVARRVNLGWWLDRFNRLLVVGLVLFAISILILRSYGSPLMGGHLPEIALAALVGALVIVALLVSRRKFIDRGEGLVRLDDRLGSAQSPRHS